MSQCGNRNQNYAPAWDTINQSSNPASYPTVGGSGIRGPCSWKAPFPMTTSPCLVKSRHYLQPWTERPSYYLDLTQPFVGGRAVRQSHNVNAIPRTMRYDSMNLVGRNFMCQQPYWGPSCM